MENEICQSCLQRLVSGNRGTEADGSLSPDYCNICYAGGEFTDPDATMERMVELRAPEMVNMIIDPGAGKALLRQWLCALKRWRGGQLS